MKKRRRRTRKRNTMILITGARTHQAISHTRGLSAKSNFPEDQVVVRLKLILCT